MKIENQSGEFAFQALYFYNDMWTLTDTYFFSLEEAKKKIYEVPVKWPVEILDNGSVYIPDESEYK